VYKVYDDGMGKEANLCVVTVVYMFQPSRRSHTVAEKICCMRENWVTGEVSCEVDGSNTGRCYGSVVVMVCAVNEAGRHSV